MLFIFLTLILVFYAIFKNTSLIGRQTALQRKKQIVPWGIYAIKLMLHNTDAKNAYNAFVDKISQK